MHHHFVSDRLPEHGLLFWGEAVDVPPERLPIQTWNWEVSPCTFVVVGRVLPAKDVAKEDGVSERYRYCDALANVLDGDFSLSLLGFSAFLGS